MPWSSSFSKRLTFLGTKPVWRPGRLSWHNDLFDIFVLSNVSKCVLKSSYNSLKIYAKGICVECSAAFDFIVNECSETEWTLNIIVTKIPEPSLHNGKKRDKSKVCVGKNWSKSLNMRRRLSFKTISSMNTILSKIQECLQ